MLLLYFILVILTQFFGEKKISKVIKIIEIPGGFSLRWINIFFTPAFITLPLSTWISAKEALTIAAVFVFGYLIATMAVAYFTIFLQFAMNKISGGKRNKKGNADRSDEEEEIELGELAGDVNNNGDVGEALLDGTTTAVNNKKHRRHDHDDHQSSDDESIYSINADDIRNNDTNLERIKSLETVPQNIIIDLPHGDENSIEEDFIKRINSRIDDKYERDLNNQKEGSSSNHLNLFRHGKKKDQQDASFPLLSPSSSSSSKTQTVELHLHNKNHSKIFSIPSLPSPIASPVRPLNPGVDLRFSDDDKLFCKRSVLEQQQAASPTGLDPVIQIGHFIRDYFDYFIFVILFIVSLPIYFVINYEMPLQLSIAIFTFLFMFRAPPQRFKKFLHPVLCSVILSWFFFYIFATMKHETFFQSLQQYKTGINYLKVFKAQNTSGPYRPGAGDIFSTLMDVSIVSLSIPMYTYRSDLKRHMLEIFFPIMVMSMGCFFIYPPMCYHLGISTERSLGFAGRSITLALGVPFVKALGGSEPLMAVTTVISGIIGALTCQPLFKLLRIRDDDYVTRGITLGVNCGAIATAHLLTVDPRAAAMSSLSFVLFGTTMVIMASIPPLAKIIQGWAGMYV